MISAIGTFLLQRMIFSPRSSLAKCRDRYAKFEVLATDTLHWAADVKYFYTSGTSFEH